MKFWCPICESDFESEIESQGYEQASCPGCEDTCLSFALEYEDAMKLVAQDQVMGSFLSWFAGSLGSLLGTKPWEAPAHSTEPPILIFARRINYRMAMVVTFDNLNDATDTQKKLQRFEIVSNISQTSGGFDIYVDDADFERAKRIVAR